MTVSIKVERRAEKQYRIGVIGLGFGSNHVQSASLLPETCLVACADLREDKRPLAEGFGARFYTDYRQMLDRERLDGVVAAVSNDQHVPVAVECLERGLPVLLEKPIAPSLVEADQIIAASERTGVPLLIGHHRRFSAFVLKAREVIEQGTIGDLVGATVIWTLLKPQVYFDAAWRTQRQTGGGPFLINLIHDVDDLRYITGREVTRVYAETSNRTRGLPVEDTISVSLRLTGDALATVMMSDCAPGAWAYELNTAPWENPFFFYAPEDSYFFFGTKGSFTLPLLRRVWYPDPDRAGWQHPLQVDQMGVMPVHPLREEMRHFCRVIARQEQPRTGGRDARRTLEVILAMVRSSETSQAVEIEG